METVKRNSDDIKLVQIHPLVNLQEKTDQPIKLTGKVISFVQTRDIYMYT